MFVVDVVRNLGYTIILYFDVSSEEEIVKSYITNDINNLNIKTNEDEYITIRDVKVEKIFNNIYLCDHNICITNLEGEIIYEFSLEDANIKKYLQDLKNEKLIDIELENLYKVINLS